MLPQQLEGGLPAGRLSVHLQHPFPMPDLAPVRIRLLQRTQSLVSKRAQDNRHSHVGIPPSLSQTDGSQLAYYRVPLSLKIANHSATPYRRVRWPSSGQTLESSPISGLALSQSGLQVCRAGAPARTGLVNLGEVALPQAE